GVIMNKRFLFSVVAAATLALTGCNDAKTSSEKVAETKQGNITKDELYEAMKGRYGAQTLRELVYEKVLSEKYKVDNKDVDAEIAKLKEQYGAQFNDVLIQSGFADEAALKRSIRVSLLQEKAATAKLVFTSKELKDYYEKLTPELKASHILVGTEKEAKDIKAKLDKGESFDKLAKDHSKDPGSASKGGDLGYFKSGQMVPEFEKAAAALKVNEVSAPVKSQFGYHIIKLTDVKEKESFEKMREDIKKELAQTKLTTEFVDQAVQEEVKNADVKISDATLKDIFKPQAPAAGGTNPHQ
ncbi:MAG: prsA, partial [Bacillales bacterium]|nr:prsA [Bacillales bacterium]